MGKRGNILNVRDTYIMKIRKKRVRRTLSFTKSCKPVNKIVMAFSKSKLYPPEFQVLSHYLKAVGHPARPVILMQLASEGESCVENMTQNHPISQASMSDHLGILREAQLIDFKEEFPYTFYSLNEKNVRRAEKSIKIFFKKLRDAIKQQKRQKGRGH